MPTVIAAITDLVLIILFAVIGRRSHDEGSALSGTLTVAAPFLIGYAIAAAVCRLDRAPRSVRRGMLIAPDANPADSTSIEGVAIEHCARYMMAKHP